ncbi:lipopolysaccharide kinase InaA family protein [Mesonia aestuariivivens]|uniref:Lipopolysaccharide kinase InaA family protein n=1 Tax=Mesonia aestuariivivens TaxID=2796128 RepID=A0ABS6W0P0_9FLAO|nr:lipopolysaccharide kinase InaA family protein [Mesonia aestuariivivens]MBW2961387.1 lipopolysaccharide kinase InaA family protein [Mesonia aestuariivivens]
MVSKYSVKYKSFSKIIEEQIKNFNSRGEMLGNAQRNVIKLFSVDREDLILNIKSFKVPNLVNQFAYKYFRKSKARRSFEYAQKLQKLGLGTPDPIAYVEFPSATLFKKSFYVSEHLEADYTYRDLTHNFEIPHHEDILRAFTRFTFQLHQKNVLFLDHSPGNTLIKINNEDYQFYLVDLNRMEFKELSFKERIKNFERLTVHKSMVKVMSDEYAKCSGESYDQIFELMWGETQKFQEKFHKKRQIKKKLKFWKK